MVQFVKISADEARTKAADRVRKTEKGEIVDKAGGVSSPKWDPQSRSARFIMTTEKSDRYGDVVVTQGIELEQFAANPVGLLFHMSRSWPVAKWDNLEKVLRARPPRLEGDFIVLPAGGPVKEVDQTAWMLENDGIRANSVGFQPNWDSVESIRDDAGNWMGLKFVESTLLECSLCAIPANAAALAKSVDGDVGLAKELIEEVLDNWARTPLGVIMPRAQFEAEYKAFGRIGESTFIQIANAAPQWISSSQVDGKAVIKQKAASVDDFRTMFGLPPATASEAATPPAVVETEKSEASEKKIEKNVLKRIGEMLGLTKAQVEPEVRQDPPVIQQPALTADEKEAIRAKALENAERLRKVI